MSQNRWLCSDHHFFHDNILKFQPEQRPFETVDHMHEVMIERHNELVKPKDIVFFGGDVVMGSKENLSIVKRMNGIKKLVVGNHDNIRSYYSAYAEVFDSIEAIREFGHGYVIFQHYPVHTCQLEKRYRACIHGHMHSNRVLDVDGNIDPRYYNICLDANDLKPTPWEKIHDHIEKYTDRHG